MGIHNLSNFCFFIDFCEYMGILFHLLNEHRNEIERFPNDLVMDFEGFLSRNLSASYSLKESDDEYQHFVEAITNLFEKYSHNGKIVMPNFTRSYLGNV